MTRTVSRLRMLRGTQATHTREIVPGDAVAPRRRQLSGAGPALPPRRPEPSAPPEQSLATARRRAEAESAPDRSELA